jgi:hypothetical protein
LPHGSPQLQEKSPFLSWLPVDVRLLIYEAVLANLERLLHILHALPGKSQQKKLKHWRCDDEDNPHLVWQHKCFGTWAEGNMGCTIAELRSNNDLISSLLVSRQM